MSKAPNPSDKTTLATVVVTTATPATQEPEDPRWQAVREGLGTMRELGRSFVEAQAWVGWWLSCLKKDHGIKQGGDRKSTGQVGRLIPWAEVLAEKTKFAGQEGLPVRTADRLIQLHEATLAKLKRGKKPEQKAALAIFKKGNPLAVPDDQRPYLRDVISSLTDGETQRSMLEHLGVVAKPVMPKKTQTEDPEAPPSDEELARHHWETAAHAITNARTGDGEKLLHLLPPTAKQPGELCLVFLRDEARALAEAAEKALATHAKSAKPGQSKPAT